MKLKVRKIQLARRAVQLSVLALVLAIPAVSRYANYMAAGELDKNLAKWEGSAPGATLSIIDAAFRVLPNGEEERAGKTIRNRDRALSRAQKFRGGPWSGQIAGVSMTDPLAAAETIAARKRTDRVLWISLIIPVLLALFLGRVFCSWICPMGFLFEMGDKLRSLARLLELPPRDYHFPRFTKFALLGAGLIIAFITAVPILGTIYPPAMVTREAHSFVFWIFDRAEEGRTGLIWGGLTWASVVLAAIVLFETLVSRRWWCRYVCPGGALYSLLGAARPVRVKLSESRCTLCAHCVPVCPMGLNPMNNEMGIDCDNCGVCISHCDDGALSYSLRPLTPTAPSVLPGTAHIAEERH